MSFPTTPVAVVTAELLVTIMVYVAVLPKSGVGASTVLVMLKSVELGRGVSVGINETVSELLPGVGSVVVLVTDAVLNISLEVLLMVVVIVSSSVVPAPILPILQT